MTNKEKYIKAMAQIAVVIENKLLQSWRILTEVI